MGNRALIQLTLSDGSISPVLYLHAAGEQVAEILMLAEASVRWESNLHCSFVLLVRHASGHFRDGIWNASKLLTAEDSPGDAGCFVVDVTNRSWSVRQGGGYGLTGKHHFPVSELGEVA